MVFWFRGVNIKEMPNAIQKMLSGERASSEPILQDEITRADVDSSLKYFVIFAALGVGGTVLFSYQLALFNAFPGLYELIATAVTGLFLLLLVIFQSMMIKSVKLNFLLAIMESVGLHSFFLGRFSALQVFGALLFIIFWYIGFVQGRKILHESIKIRFTAFASTILSYALIGFALLLSLLYAGLYQSGSSFSSELYHSFLSGSAPAIRSIVPNFAPEMTVDGFFENFVAGRLDKYTQISTDISGPEKERATREIASEVRNQLLKDMAPVQSNESVAQYSYRLLAEQFKKLNDKGFGVFVLVAIAALLFFPLRLILLILKWPILILAYIIFSGLQISGIIQVLTEKRDKELLVVR